VSSRESLYARALRLKTGKRGVAGSAGASGPSAIPRRGLHGDSAQGCPELRFLKAHVGFRLAERGPVLHEDLAREAFGCPELFHRHAYGTAAGFGAQNFPLATSLRMSMASSFSASRRLGRAFSFSFSSSLVRLDASAFFSDPYWFSQPR
jgi:hypothetical protein